MRKQHTGSTQHPHSKTARSAVYVVLALVLLAPVAFAQSQLSGYWDLQIHNSDGSVRDTYFELEQSGDALTGRLFGRVLGGTPLEGTVQGSAIHFSTVTPPNARNPRPTSFDGTFSNGALELQVSGRGQSPASALRTTREKADPAPLPLPSLHPLPDNGLVRTPPMGWNSWNKFAGRITDADVRGMADAMVASGMSKLGYTYINIDDTWESGRDAAGNITTNNKFPDMKALADYVHSKGLKIGIYSSPGPRTCAQYEGSLGHEVQDAKQYAAWGFDYLKYDLCSASSVYNTADTDVQRGLYQKMGEALQASGRPIVFSMCQYGQHDPWTWGADAGGNLWRTTGDISDHWESMDRIGFSQIAISQYTRPGHWNDPDMLEIGNGGMSADEYRTHMSLWSMLAAPLIAGNDLRAMSDETRSILMNADVIAVDQDPAARPVERLSTGSLNAQGHVEILTRPMQDGSLIVGIFNRGPEAASASLPWASLPVAYTHPAHIRDLWAHTSTAPAGTQYTTQVPSHGVTLLRIDPTH